MKPSAKHLWSVPCQKSTIDQDTNSISLFDITERLEIGLSSEFFDKQKEQEKKGFVIPLNFEIVSYWKRISEKDVKDKMKLSILDPKNKELASFEMDVNIPKNINAVRLRAKFNQFKATVSGVYCIQIHHIYSKKSEIVSELPIEVFINNKE